MTSENGIELSWRPSHAYIPGQTPRHAEDLFDECKSGIANFDLAHFNQTATWALANTFLAEGYYWEAHELFEAIWMQCPPNAPEKLLVQSLIQRANARLKRLMGQTKAETRLASESMRLWDEAFRRAGRPIWGIQSGDFDKF